MYEKFSSFVATDASSRKVKSGFAFDITPENLCFLSGLDRIEWSQFEKSYLDLRGKHDLLIFTFYSGGIQYWNSSNDDYPSIMSSSRSFHQILRTEIEARRISVLFLRGTSASVPSRLGFVNPHVNHGYVDYVQGKLEVNLNAIKELSVKSSNFSLFLQENAKYFNEESNTVCCNPPDTYMCGIDEKSLVDVQKWNVLMSSVDHPKHFSLLIHKEYKVMFTPWYGFSHGKQLAHDIVLYFCRYLLNDAFRSESSMKTRLWNQLSEFPQLGDISFRYYSNNHRLFCNLLLGSGI